MKKHYIEVMKGIGAIFVVIGHLVTPDSFLKIYLYSFHMPLFFFITGITFNENRPFKTFLYKRFKSLIVPYFAFVLPSAVIFFDITKNMGLKDILTNIFFIDSSIIWNSSLWFLPVLFLTNILFYIICKICKTKITKTAGLILLILSGFLFSHYQIILPLGLHILPISTTFLFFGYLFTKLNFLEKLRGKEINHYIFFIATALSIYLAVKNGRVNMSTNTYNNYIIYYICALCGILTYLYISLVINKNKLLEFFGSISLYMFCTQRMLYKFYPLIFEKLNINSLYTPKFTIILTLIIYFIYFVSFRKIKAKIKKT